MSKQVEGVVKYVGINDNGYYNVKMDDDSWFGFGKKKPAINKGDTITFQAEKNGKYWNADADTLEVIDGGDAEEAEEAPAKKAAPKARSGGAAGKDDYWNRKEERDLLVQNEIRLQASRNAAVEVLSVALANKLVAIPEGKKKNGQFEVFLTYIDKLTQKYYDATVAVNGKPAPAAKAAPKAAEPDPTEANEPESYEDLNDEISF